MVVVAAVAAAPPAAGSGSSSSVKRCRELKRVLKLSIVM